jgi:phosphinothricin acetyltransferase
MTPVIRLATPDDAAGVQAIYAPIVRDTEISFELDPPTAADMRQRIIKIQKRHCWLVCEHAGEVLGYAYASRHHERWAYQWSVNLSIYIHEAARHHGLGRALHTSLFEVLRLQGYYMAYAGITLPNPASVGLHEKMGFTAVGVYKNSGYKFGQWWDVGYWQRELQPLVAPPQPPVTIDVARRSRQWDAALAAGLPLLRL